MTITPLVQIGFTFLALAHPGSPGQRSVKYVVVVVVVVVESVIYRYHTYHHHCKNGSRPIRSLFPRNN